MKFNFKKIASVLASAVMLTSTIGVGLAANYPSPLVEDGQADGAIVVGSNLPSNLDSAADYSAATDLADDINENYVDDSGASASASIGEESVLFEDGELYFGDTISETFDDRDFEDLLTEETLEDDEDDVSDVDYVTEIDVSEDGTIDFDELDEDQYHVYSDEAEDQIPVLHLDMSNGVAYTVKTDFYSEVDFTDYEDSETITIAGQELVINPNMEDEDDDVLSFYESSETVTIESGESVTMDGKEIEVTGGIVENREANLVIDGKSYSGLETGDEKEGVYLKDVATSDVGDASSLQVEVMVGSAEWVIDEDELEIDGEDVDGVSVDWAIGGTYNHSAVDNINFEVTPSEMDEDYLEELLGIDADDDPEDKVQILEMGGEFIDPVFGFGIFFEGSEPEVGEGESDLDFSAGGDELTIDFTGRDEVEYSIQPYEYKDTDEVHVHEDWFVSSNNESAVLQNLTDDDIFIIGSDTVAEDEVTNIYRVDGLEVGDSGEKDEITLVNVGSGEERTYRDGDEIEDSGLYVSEISGDGAKFNILNTDSNTYNGSWDASNVASVQNEIVTENEVEITLNDLNQSNSTTNLEGDTNITLEEDRDGEIKESSNTFDSMEVNVNADNGDDELQIGKVTYNDDDQDVASNSETDIEYSVSELGTYTELDTDDDAFFNVWSPEEEVEYKISIASLGESDDSVNDNKVTVTTDDDMSDVENKNLIVVGGSCVNDLAAEILEVDSQTCGSDFTEASGGVESGNYLIKAVESPYNDEKVAVLAAGYSASDTEDAVGNLMEGHTTDVGTDEIYPQASD